MGIPRGLVLLSVCLILLGVEAVNDTSLHFVSYEWKVSDWSECSAKCDGGTAFRDVHCYSSHGYIIFDHQGEEEQLSLRLCGAEMRPPDQSSCNEQECVEWSPDRETVIMVQVYFVVVFVITTLCFIYVLSGVPSRPSSAPYKRRLLMHLNGSTGGMVLEIINAVFSIISCVLFVYESYEGDRSSRRTLITMFMLELMFSTTFLYSYLIWFYASERKLKYIFSVMPMVDLLTVPPVFFMFFVSTFAVGEGVGFLRFTRIMKFARVLRLLRILKSVTAVSSVTQDAIRNQFINFVTLCLSLVICTTGFVHFVGNEVESYPGAWGDHEGDMEFHDALYFTIVSFALVGYGDMAPRGVVGRLAILALIAISFILIPLEMNKLLRMYRMRSAYGGSLKLGMQESHIVLACDPTCSGVADFLKEFFHKDHGSQHTRVCILCSGEPTISMQELILRRKRVQYIKGDAMVPNDLVRARVDVADAVFLLADRFARRVNEQDAVTVLRSINVMSFNRRSKIYVQIIAPETKPHIVAAGIPANHILCVNEIRLSLLGTSINHPGASTLVSNLVTSHSAHTLAVSGKTWLANYSYGLSQEIYCVRLLLDLGPVPFPVLAEKLYGAFGVTLLGLKDGDQGVLLNPGMQVAMRRGDHGFLVANDVAQIAAIKAFGDASQDLFAIAERADKQQHGKHSKQSTTRVEPAGGTGLELSGRNLADASLRHVDQVRGDVARRKTCKQHAIHAVSESDHSDGDVDVAGEAAPAGHACGVKLNDKCIHDFERVDRLLYHGVNGSQYDERRRSARENILSVVQGFIDKGKDEDNSHPPESLQAALLSASDEVIRKNNVALTVRSDMVPTAVYYSGVRSRRSVHRSMEETTRETVRNYLCNHLIIVCYSMQNLRFLIDSVRKGDNERRAILLLCPVLPSSAAWKHISHYRNIHLVHGSPQTWNDLLRAGIESCYAILVLSDSSSSNTNTNTHFFSGDANVVLTCLSIEFRSNKKVFGNLFAQSFKQAGSRRAFKLVAELNSTPYIKHMRVPPNKRRILRASSLSKPPEVIHQSFSTGGKSFRARLPLYSEVDNNETTIDPQQRSFRTDDVETYIYQPAYVSGEVVSSTFLESLLCQAFFNPHLLVVVHALVGLGKSNNVDMKQVAVSRQFVNKPYGKLFSHLVLRCNCMPIAIYRKIFGTNDCFVMTNPQKDTTLLITDKVFVLSNYSK